MRRARLIDQEGAWHHVFNRGVIALHALVFLTTHHHLLLRGTSGA